MMGRFSWQFVALVVCAAAASTQAGGDPAVCADVSPSWQYAPAISGDIVVWQDSRNMKVSGWDIYGYDLATGEEFPVCTAPGKQEAAAIDGKVVVWQDERTLDATGSDIYRRDLETGEEYPVCTAPGNQSRPGVDGRFVIWEDWRNFSVTGPDVYAYDLTTGDEFPVCTAAASQRSPDISNDVAAWEDWRRDSDVNASSDILTSRMPTPAAAVTSPEETRSVAGPPIVYDISVSTKEGEAAVVTLGPSEVSGQKLTYEIVMGPSHGKLIGTGPTRVYRPSAGYSGVDTLWFKASDGKSDSNVALVSVAVIPVDQAPGAQSQQVMLLKGSAREIALQAADADGDALTYRVVEFPAHGRLLGSAPALTYVPSPGYVGADAVVFRASDGVLESNDARISIVVREENTAPEAAWQEVEVSANIPRQLVLVGTDGDGDRLTYAIAASPAHGRLEGPIETGCITYVPEQGYTGADRFAFVASDGLSESRPAAVSIRVVAQSDG